MGHGLKGLLLCDEGPGIGLGHRRRMEALRRALRHASCLEVTIAVLGGPVPGRVDLVVVDSYRVRADEHPIAASTVAAVDDLERDLRVDIVIDPTPGAGGESHRAAGTVLAGAPYALVEEPPLPGRPVTPAVKTVLVTTGAADAAGLGADIAAALVPAVPGARIQLVVGPWGSTAVPRGVSAVTGAHGLAEPLAASDLVVCSGGVTMLEALSLGRPIIAVVTAENQRRAVAGAAAAGAVVACRPEDAPATAASLAGDPARRANLSAEARQLIDGRGPERVAQRLLLDTV